jgi:DnaJ family protein A protein 5
MAARQAMRCHYEVLGVERTANADELKTVYRKLALKWHPDKNMDQQEEAHRRFQEIQGAYAVLNDPQERSWYDSHRESILRGGDGTMDEEGGAVHHEGVNIWPYFNASCFRGFGDEEDGFYAVYARLFATLDDEEDTYAPPKEGGGVNKSDKAPSFGTSKSEWADVHRFYSYWEAFFTRKTFAWCDRYNTTQADGRYPSPSPPLSSLPRSAAQLLPFDFDLIYLILKK